MKNELLKLVNNSDVAYSYIVDSILDFGLYASVELLEITDKFNLGEKLHNNDIYNLIEELKSEKEETTKVLTKSIKLRKEVLNYTCGNQSQPQLLTTMPVIEMLDKFDNKVITKNKEFIEMYLNLFNDYSTLKLRELCKIVGFDYWSGLSNSNRIDTLDSVFANFKN